MNKQDESFVLDPAREKLSVLLTAASELRKTAFNLRMEKVSESIHVFSLCSEALAKYYAILRVQISMTLPQRPTVATQQRPKVVFNPYKSNITYVASLIEITTAHEI